MHRQAIAGIQGIPGASGAWWTGRFREAIEAEKVASVALAPGGAGCPAK